MEQPGLTVTSLHFEQFDSSTILDKLFKLVQCQIKQLKESADELHFEKSGSLSSSSGKLRELRAIFTALIDSVVEMLQDLVEGATPLRQQQEQCYNNFETYQIENSTTVEHTNNLLRKTTALFKHKAVGLAEQLKANRLKLLSGAEQNEGIESRYTAINEILGLGEHLLALCTLYEEGIQKAHSLGLAHAHLSFARQLWHVVDGINNLRVTERQHETFQSDDQPAGEGQNQIAMSNNATKPKTSLCDVRLSLSSHSQDHFMVEDSDLVNIITATLELPPPLPHLPTGDKSFGNSPITYIFERENQAQAVDTVEKQAKQPIQKSTGIPKAVAEDTYAYSKLKNPLVNEQKNTHQKGLQAYQAGAVGALGDTHGLGLAHAQNIPVQQLWMVMNEGIKASAMQTENQTQSNKRNRQCQVISTPNIQDRSILDRLSNRRKSMFTELHGSFPVEDPDDENEVAVTVCELHHQVPPSEASGQVDNYSPIKTDAIDMYSPGASIYEQVVEVTERENQPKYKVTTEIGDVKKNEKSVPVQPNNILASGTELEKATSMKGSSLAKPASSSSVSGVTDVKEHLQDQNNALACLVHELPPGPLAETQSKCTQFIVCTESDIQATSNRPVSTTVNAGSVLTALGTLPSSTDVQERAMSYVKIDTSVEDLGLHVLPLLEERVVTPEDITNNWMVTFEANIDEERCTQQGNCESEIRANHVKPLSDWTCRNMEVCDTPVENTALPNPIQLDMDKTPKHQSPSISASMQTVLMPPKMQGLDVSHELPLTVPNTSSEMQQPLHPVLVHSNVTSNLDTSTSLVREKTNQSEVSNQLSHPVPSEMLFDAVPVDVKHGASETPELLAKCLLRSENADSLQQSLLQEDNNSPTTRPSTEMITNGNVFKTQPKGHNINNDDSAGVYSTKESSQIPQSILNTDSTIPRAIPPPAFPDVIDEVQDDIHSQICPERQETKIFTPDEVDQLLADMERDSLETSSNVHSTNIDLDYSHTGGIDDTSVSSEVDGAAHTIFANRQASSKTIAHNEQLLPGHQLKQLPKEDRMGKCQPIYSGNREKISVFQLLHSQKEELKRHHLQATPLPLVAKNHFNQALNCQHLVECQSTHLQNPRHLQGSQSSSSQNQARLIRHQKDQDQIKEVQYTLLQERNEGSSSESSDNDVLSIDDTSQITTSPKALILTTSPSSDTNKQTGTFVTTSKESIILNQCRKGKYKSTGAYTNNHVGTTFNGELHDDGGNIHHVHSEDSITNSLDRRDILSEENSCFFADNTNKTRGIFQPNTHRDGCTSELHDIQSTHTMKLSSNGHSIGTTQFRQRRKRRRGTAPRGRRVITGKKSRVRRVLFTNARRSSTSKKGKNLHSPQSGYGIGQLVCLPGALMLLILVATKQLVLSWEAPLTETLQEKILNAASLNYISTPPS